MAENKKQQPDTSKKKGDKEIAEFAERPANNVSNTFKPPNNPQNTGKTPGKDKK